VGADLDPEGNAVELVFVELESGVAPVAVVELDADPRVVEVVGDALGVLEHFVFRVLLPDGDDDDLLGGDAGREHEPLLVGVRVMMSAPSARHESPHEVVCAIRSSSSSSENVMSNASANDCPRWWEVPACTDFPSGISASTVVVVSAPGNLSWSGFWPFNTGIASRSS